VAAWLAQADPAGLMYGAIITGAVLATSSGHGAADHFVLLAGAGVLVIYWLTHAYVHAFAKQFHGETESLPRRFFASTKSEASVLKGGLPGLAVFALARLFGASVSGAALVALYGDIVLLAAVGYLGSHHAGLSKRASVGEAFGAALLGVAMVAVKALLH
jgi:hypothetical protein